MTRIDDLPPFARHWTQAAMTWSDDYWDDSAGLLRSPGDDDRHTVRNTVWYASGLLMRGDDERAHQAIASILQYQFDEPDSVFHGTFKRAPQEPHPPANPTEWRDYDPNWREFICTVLLVLLDEFTLPDDLQAKIWTSISKAATGAYARKVPARYTNIALMSAFLLDHAGAKLNIPAWRERGDQLAREIFDLFSQHNSFWEYNSPTYYGVDLFALALWRKYGLTATFRDLGTQMEAAFWRDIAQFYHAGLRNLCGPYDRSYGMDMCKYLTVLGLSIGLAVSPEQAPLPDPTRPFDHASDFFFMPAIALLGTQVADDALPHFRSFRGERHIERTIEQDRIATAWVSENLMIGAETKHESRLPNDQFHPATAHWRLPNGETGWLRLRCDEPVSARATPNTLTITCASPRPIRFEMFAGKATPDAIQGGNWSLPGVGITLDLADVAPSVAVDSDRLNVLIDAPAGRFTLRVVHSPATI